MTLRRGFELEPGEPVVVVEDVITTGRSTREVLEVVQAQQAPRAGGGQPGRPHLGRRRPGRAAPQPAPAGVPGLPARGVPLVRRREHAREAGLPGALTTSLYRIVLAYDGTDFEGWQVQSSRRPSGAPARTVQGELESALRRLDGGAPVRVKGAGRTDAGVHALGQVASFELPRAIEPAALQRALNGLLPPDVRVREAAHGAAGLPRPPERASKLYRYELDTGPVQLPTRRRQAGHVPWRSTARAWRRRRPSSWAATTSRRSAPAAARPRPRSARSRARTRAWEGATLVYEVEADGFLRKMVRSLVGGLIAAGRGAVDRGRPAAGPRRPRPARLAGARGGARPHPGARGLPGGAAGVNIAIPASANVSPGPARRRPLGLRGAVAPPRHRLRAPAPPRGHHHGRQRPLGEAARTSGAWRAIARASPRCATWSRPRPAWACEVLTLYAFSVENWKRPKAEVATLMALLKRYLRLELETLLQNNIRFQVIGRMEELPTDVQEELQRGMERTAALHRAALQHRAQLRRPRRDHRRRAAPGAGRAAQRPRRRSRIDEALLSSLPLHRRPARPRPAHPHQRRAAHLATSCSGRSPTPRSG